MMDLVGYMLAEVMMMVGYGRTDWVGYGRENQSFLPLSYEKGSWYYFYGELDQRRLLYDYGEERWVNLDDTAMDESKGKELEQ